MITIRYKLTILHPFYMMGLAYYYGVLYFANHGDVVDDPNPIPLDLLNPVKQFTKIFELE
jgi:hypothetical protein